VLDPLTGAVADLQGREAAADLLLDVAGQGGDGDGDAGDTGMVFGDGGRAGRQGVRHRRQQAGAAFRQVQLMRQGAAQGVVQPHQVGVQGVQLAAAHLDAVVDLLGEDREFGTGRGDAAGGDLDVDREDPEIG
jgi:hypothetical protein